MRRSDENNIRWTTWNQIRLVQKKEKEWTGSPSFSMYQYYQPVQTLLFTQICPYISVRSPPCCFVNKQHTAIWLSCSVCQGEIMNLKSQRVSIKQVSTRWCVSSCMCSPGYNLELYRAWYDNLSIDVAIQQEFLFSTPCFQHDAEPINSPQIPLESFYS